MNGVVGCLFIIVGLVAAISPYSAWYLSVGWKFKDAEPSDLALGVERIVGIVLVIAGFIMVISSCSAGSADRNWPDKFKEKLAAGEVQEISIGFVSPVTLTTEETTEVVRMMEEAELTPMDSSNVYGANNSGSMMFTDQTSVEIVFFGNSGSIELHPSRTEKIYIINSEDLEKWYRVNYSNK
ncbi:DUF6199 family natural product biosynthesis protein [Paenibacillus gallinarum]|uniref:DUF6199 domain-containing protein n=1 Tax=Paenibacillus gallinarum TaxID=2762232 RepID=A0ABR8T497_9BACL|nr:DUF6199 family natural product biosynthesis protein [Paenibacillus gallinarum]MBD7970585.1 hypothetical protein [Paenibacillus gallinarum]